MNRNDVGATCDDYRENLDKFIEPQDVFFIIGNNSLADCIPRKDTGAQKDNTSKALDLSKYRAVNGQIVNTSDIMNTCRNKACCETKV